MNIKHLLLTLSFCLACYPAFNEIQVSATQDSLKGMPVSILNHARWSSNCFIYEVNIRQYSVDGTFVAFEKDLPRLKSLGVGILWLMPINPIGELNRKGKLGSYYAVKDYKAVNSEFGNLNDFIHLVKTIHSQGMKVILDWVPNHTAFDNELVKNHPEYYMHDSLGKMISPFDWTDVVRLDYSKKITRDYMTETMKWWIKKTDIDGFRVDVALMLPVDFCNELRKELDKVKPVFMLGETDKPEQQVGCFDMSYDWKFHHIMNDIAAGKSDASAVLKHFEWVSKSYPSNAYLMEFTSNHDENTWNGSEYERLGNGAPTFAVVAATIQGMGLIYNGQESAFKRRLRFFDKDTINWSNYPLSDFYQKLISLKKRNHALWNGNLGTAPLPVETGNEKFVLGFCRQKDKDEVIVFANLSDKDQKINVNFKSISGKFRNAFTNQIVDLKTLSDAHMVPWQYIVLEKIE